MVTACPECDAPTYLGGTECMSCGWHKPGATIVHANFSTDPECRWCHPHGVSDSA